MVIIRRMIQRKKEKNWSSKQLDIIIRYSFTCFLKATSWRQRSISLVRWSLLNFYTHLSTSNKEVVEKISSTISLYTVIRDAYLTVYFYFSETESNNRMCASANRILVLLSYLTIAENETKKQAQFSQIDFFSFCYKNSIQKIKWSK